MLGKLLKQIIENEKHLCYRESVLTKLLKESLGGNAFLTIIICASMAQENAEETYSSLEFGERAKMVKNTAIVNKIMGIDDYKAKIVAMEAKIAAQDEIIE